ncbi:hypothetical protein Fcan01_16968 [Folsomia candida]|uniref:Uncharacterized protein n=1 Tax=Folsomia candida TaxID=158441 RepID=A0A226DQK3_FOLCA|nr:hypothetical protein Fcan01_16968 [Folsomia candida]
MQAGNDQTATQLNNLDLTNMEYLAMKTLTNPLGSNLLTILTKVFCSLDVKTLKSARFVCTVWDHVGAKFLGQKARLTFSSSPKYRLNYCKFTNLKELTSFNHKLSRNVTLVMICDCSLTCQCPPNQVEACRNLPPNFAICFSEFFDELDTLKFFVGRTLQPRWHEMWGTHQFQNLTQICNIVEKVCHDDSWWGDEDEVKTRLEVPQFRPLRNLKVLSVMMSAGQQNHFASDFLSPISQGLLNYAPNLEKFELEANFYPDLTPCRKLDEIKFTNQDARCDEYSRKLDVPEMTRMLEAELGKSRLK